MKYMSFLEIEMKRTTSQVWMFDKVTIFFVCFYVLINMYICIYIIMFSCSLDVLVLCLGCLAGSLSRNARFDTKPMNG